MVFLYVNIGRGHPFYLDGILRFLPEGRAQVRDVRDVTGVVGAIGWRLAEQLYLHGSSWAGGQVYALIRGRAAGVKQHWPELVLGRMMQKHIGAWPAPVVVSHPLLARMLKNYPQVVYQHGELVLPPEAFIHGAGWTIVPTAALADELIKRGFAKERLMVSGLCVEPELADCAMQHMQARRARCFCGGALTGAFFSSGAEPLPHVRLIVRAAAAAARAGGHVLIFARENGRLMKQADAYFGACRLPAQAAELPAGRVGMVCYRTRQELYAATIQWFASFDYFVAPAHERTNWALGLGLPMFILEPAIGTFAPLNRELLLRHGAAEPLQSAAVADDFGRRLAELRGNGWLDACAAAALRRGWNLCGFRNIAAWLLDWDQAKNS